MTSRVPLPSDDAPGSPQGSSLAPWPGSCRAPSCCRSSSAASRRGRRGLRGCAQRDGLVPPVWMGFPRAIFPNGHLPPMERRFGFGLLAGKWATTWITESWTLRKPHGESGRKELGTWGTNLGTWKWKSRAQRSRGPGVSAVLAEGMVLPQTLATARQDSSEWPAKRAL